MGKEMVFSYVLCCCCFTEYKKKVKEAEQKSDFQDEAFFSTLIADLYTKYGNYLLFTLNTVTISSLHLIW